MSPARKVHAKRRHTHNKRWIIVGVGMLLIVTLVTVAYIKFPISTNSTNGSNLISSDPAFTTFTNHYLTIMKNLNSTQTKTAMASQFNLNYNQTDLFTWEATKLTFNQSQIGWYEDPIQILGDGRGICVQWSVVYVSACLSLGYQSRLVVAANTNWNFIHVWAEDYYNGSWVHVDPSDKVWNNPSKYQIWGWGNIGTDVKIYAFEDGTFRDVTSTYSAY
jgi:hypothetical protein